MKKYRYCFLLLLGLVLVVLIASLLFIPGRLDEETETQTESVTLPEETGETVEEDQIVINQEQVQPSVTEENYLLVSEDGFLLVFGRNPSEICLYTHIPLAEFPGEEQDKLRQGIWFGAMEEIYSYLESYTS